MKLEVGMYCRTLNGIVKIDKIKDSIMIDTKGKTHFGDFIKASYNIIDLIEVGDYINGYMVENIDAGLNGDIIEIATGTNYFQSPSLHNEDIKSIVTKEQFEQMAYKVGD